MSSQRTRRRRQTKNISTTQKAKKIGLHEKLEEEDLLAIHEAFKIAPSKNMNRLQLRSCLHDLCKIDFEDDEFETLFLKINQGRNGLVTWDEFISYLLLCFRQMDIVAEYSSLDLPIAEKPRVLKSNHRHPICRITFYPTVKPDGSTSWKDGSIVTGSKDGVINYWSLDLQLERTVQSTCPLLKVQQTWITDLCILPDVSVICTSSTERDLRFYDTSARKFELRVMFSSLDYAVCAMSYSFSADSKEECKLIAGDMGGNIKIITFSSFGRGPFKSKPGLPLLHVRYEKVLKGLVGGFKVVEFKNVHTDWVRQVHFYSALQCIVSCSDCNKRPLIMKDLSETRINNVFRVPKGIWCFAVADGVHLMATGGPDCLVCVWNPFLPTKPTMKFIGHHTGVVALIFQDGAKKLASLSKDKCIKIWDLQQQICLQTYVNLPQELGERTNLSFLYNPESREMIICSLVIAIVHLCPLQSGDHTDGNTHSAGVSVVLYNPLFKVVATCGLDSYIIIWDPWTGRRMNVIKEAHTRLRHGERIPVEITAATFDPGNHFLLTGAHDGSLKMWNFNTGTCYRNMSIKSNCEVTSLIWIKGRILAAGWNKHITEFNDTGVAVGPGGAFSKNWDKRHKDDILCAAVRVPQAVVTSTFSGEIIMWQLETGQAYKKYNVSSPTVRIKLEYKIHRGKRTEIKSSPTAERSRDTRSQSVIMSKPLAFQAAPASPKFMTPAARARKVSMVQMPETCVPLRGLAVNCMLFLESRPSRPDYGTLFIALENGTVQVWSHHVAGGFITSFSANHKAGDNVICMITDKKNEYLFTGTAIGYIKIWLMLDYCTPEKVKISMPRYRMMFPFLWKDRMWVGRAKRMTFGQSKPMLLTSWKAHQMAVSALTYLEEAQIIVSGSADSSTRMWTLSGRYLQTIGTFKPWKNLEVDTPPPPTFEHTIPPDIYRICSSTTYKVLNGGVVHTKLSKQQEEKEKTKERQKELTISKVVYGKRVTDPILGNFYSVPKRDTQRHEFQLDTSFAYIPVYQHLIMPPPKEMPAIKEPEVISELHTEEGKKRRPTLMHHVRTGSFMSLSSVKNSLNHKKSV